MFRSLVYLIFITGILIYVWNTFGHEIENYFKEKLIKIVFDTEIKSISNLKDSKQFEFIRKNLADFISGNREKSFTEFYENSKKYFKKIKIACVDSVITGKEINEFNKILNRIELEIE